MPCFLVKMFDCFDDPSWRSIYFVLVLDILLLRVYFLLKSYNESIVELDVEKEFFIFVGLLVLYFFCFGKRKEFFFDIEGADFEGGIEMENSEGPNYKVPCILGKNKELFEKEYTRNLELMKFHSISASGVFGVYIAVLGAYIFIFKSVSEIKGWSRFEEVIFFFFLGIGAVSTINGIYCVMKSLVPKDNYKVFSPREIEKLINERWDNYDDRGIEIEGEKKLYELEHEEDLNYDIVMSYIAYGEIAVDINEKRFALLMDSRKFLLCSLFILLISSCLFFLFKERYSLDKFSCFFVFCFFVHLAIQQHFGRGKKDG